MPKDTEGGAAEPGVKPRQGSNTLSLYDLCSLWYQGKIVSMLTAF